MVRPRLHTAVVIHLDAMRDFRRNAPGGRTFKQRRIQDDLTLLGEDQKTQALAARNYAISQPVGERTVCQTAPPLQGTSGPDCSTPTQLDDQAAQGLSAVIKFIRHARDYSAVLITVNRLIAEWRSGLLNAMLAGLGRRIFGMVRPAPLPRIDLESLDAIAARLEAAREAAGVDRVELCRRIGIGTSAYGNYLGGKKQCRPDPKTASAICRAIDITTDWIYRGSLAGLPEKMRAALSQHPYAAP